MHKGLITRSAGREEPYANWLKLHDTLRRLNLNYPLLSVAFFLTELGRFLKRPEALPLNKQVKAGP